MSIQFSDTTNKNGIIQKIEETCGFDDAGISDNTTLLAQFTGNINTTVDQILGFMFPRGGTWQLDDANHTDYPIIFANIVSGQRDYTFSTDEDGNYILDIERVMVSDENGVFGDLKRIDQQTPDSDVGIVDGRDLTGAPYAYDKTANGILLEPIPDFSYTAGLKVFISREATRFLTTDTAKVLGFAHLYHEYLVLRPSYIYARNNSLTNVDRLKRDTKEMEEEIKTYFETRQKDVRNIMKPKKILYV